jgi:hypothetical protein
MIDLKKFEIETDLSFLNIYTFNDTELINKCIEELNRSKKTFLISI